MQRDKGHHLTASSKPKRLTGTSSETSWGPGKITVSILKILDKENAIIGSREISKRLKLYGIDLTERAVRYHLKILDEMGYTRVFGKEGRMITEKGREELQNALVLEKASFVISKIDTLSYLTTLNLDSLEGDVILNISSLDKKNLDRALKIMEPVFQSPYIMSNRVIIAGDGDPIGDIVIPKGRIGIGTICSITINGIFLKAGIPMTSRFGGVAEIVNRRPERFIALISYEGSSLDPHEVFIRSKMTDVLGAVKKGEGRILVSFREIPVVCLDKAKAVAEELYSKGIRGILVIGEPNKPVLGVQPGIDRVGMVIAGGLNPIAALQESGIDTESTAMSTLYPFLRLSTFGKG